jgi:NAD(P)-dependent dehydrogenase (short-subunit alcohol dehydrogenase family)
MEALKGKTAIVTGAAGGIGAATAALFVREGASVMAVDRDEEGLARTAREIGGDRIAICVADVSSPADVERYVAAAVSRFGGLDILFANAGIEGRVAPIVSQRPEDLRKVLAINVEGPFYAIQAAAPHLARRGGGSIVVTSSVAGLIGSSGLAPYVMSKHAVGGLVKCAALELAAQKTRVNSIHPGPIENRMMRSIEEQAAPGQASVVKDGFIAQIPLGRYGTNEEIARLALFLGSDASSYCTGAAFVADGGFVAH